jgi:hypothetical protein
MVLANRRTTAAMTRAASMCLRVGIGGNGIAAAVASKTSCSLMKTIGERETSSTATGSGSSGKAIAGADAFSETDMRIISLTMGRVRWPLSSPSTATAQELSSCFVKPMLRAYEAPAIRDRGTSCRAGAVSARCRVESGDHTAPASRRLQLRR